MGVIFGLDFGKYIVRLDYIGVMYSCFQGIYRMVFGVVNWIKRTWRDFHYWMYGPSHAEYMAIAYEDFGDFEVDEAKLLSDEEIENMVEVGVDSDAILS